MALAALSIDNAKVQHFSCASKFRASIWGDFQHEFDEFERTVARACLACYRRDARISSPRIRNFLPSKITFPRFRATISVWPQIMTEWQWQN